MNLDQAVKATDALMLEAVQSDIPVLADASRHIIGAGGKRVRPRLLFLSYLAMGGTDLERAVPIATAVELVHTATLVHDDINDHGSVRRGRTTINEKWGRTFALLTGDFLFTKVYELMAPHKDLNVTLAEATVALVEGETLQAWAAKNDALNREIYQQIVAKKTASLFRASAMLGGQLVEANDSDVHLLGEFGFYLGLAFQIVDDLLDLVGDPSLVGKDVRIDVGQGKGVAVQSGNGHSQPVGSPVAVMDVDVKTEDDPFLEIKRRLIEGGAVEEGRQMAQMIAMQAEETLNQLGSSEHIMGMRELLHLVVSRDH